MENSVIIIKQIEVFSRQVESIKRIKIKFYNWKEIKICKEIHHVSLTADGKWQKAELGCTQKLFPRNYPTEDEWLKSKE